MTETVKCFNSHPFRVLGASPRDSRERLIALRGEAALFGQAEAAETALSALLHPDSRLKAELGWFPMTEEGEIASLLRFAGQEKAAGPAPAFHTRSFLAVFNQARLCVSMLPLPGADAFSAALDSLSLCADTLLPDQVMWELNEDRKASGFPLLASVEELDAALSDLLNQTASDLLRRGLPSLRGLEARRLSQRLLLEYRNVKSPRHNSFLLRLTADALAIQE